MLTLNEIIKKLDASDQELSKLFESLLGLIKKLQDMKKLERMEVIVILDSVATIILKMEDVFDKLDFRLSEKLSIKYESSNYFDQIESSLVDQDIDFNLIEAIEVLYQIFEVMNKFKLENIGRNHALNVLHELYLELKQHFLYHFSFIKNSN